MNSYTSAKHYNQHCNIHLLTHAGVIVMLMNYFSKFECFKVCNYVLSFIIATYSKDYACHYLLQKSHALMVLLTLELVMIRQLIHHNRRAYRWTCSYIHSLTCLPAIMLTGFLQNNSCNLRECLLWCCCATVLQTFLKLDFCASCLHSLFFASNLIVHK